MPPSWLMERVSKLFFASSTVKAPVTKQTVLSLPFIWKIIWKRESERVQSCVQESWRESENAWLTNLSLSADADLSWTNTFSGAQFHTCKYVVGTTGAVEILSYRDIINFSHHRNPNGAVRSIFPEPKREGRTKSSAKRAQGAFGPVGCRCLAETLDKSDASPHSSAHVTFQ